MNISNPKLLIDLPEYIYYSFRDYLSQDDYQQLLNTSKSIFILTKRNSIIYRLTAKYSIKYCEDKNFRNQLLQKVENPSKQIIIRLDYSKIQRHEELFNLVPVYLICTSFPYTTMQNIKELILEKYYENTTFLDFSQCAKVTYSCCNEVTDISVLKDCEDVTLFSCENIRDFSSLGK